MREPLSTTLGISDYNEGKKYFTKNLYIVLPDNKEDALVGGVLVLFNKKDALMVAKNYRNSHGKHCRIRIERYDNGRIIETIIHDVSEIKEKDNELHKDL